MTLSEHRDSPTAEIVRHALIAATGQVNVSLVHAAQSPVIQAAKDCSVGGATTRVGCPTQRAGLVVFWWILGAAARPTTAWSAWTGSTMRSPAADSHRSTNACEANRCPDSRGRERRYACRAATLDGSCTLT